MLASIQPVSQKLVHALLTDDEETSLDIAGELAQNSATQNLIYSSSKQAISRWVRREAPKQVWAGNGIPLNAVAPGTVITPMTAELLSSKEGLSLVDAVVPMPLNYHQPAESISNLLIWLTSPENTHCCGQTIYCDGGADAVLRGDDVWAWNEEAISKKFEDIASTLKG